MTYFKYKKNTRGVLDRRVGHTDEQIAKRKEDFERLRAKALLSDKFIRKSSDLELKKLHYLGVISDEKYNNVMD